MSVFLLKLYNEQKVLKQLDIVFLTLLTYILVIAIYHYIFGEFSGNKDLLLWNISGVLFNLECYLIGKFINLRNESHRRFLFFSFFFIALIFFINVQDGFKHF